jgi:hypothetical protein
MDLEMDLTGGQGEDPVASDAIGKGRAESVDASHRADSSGTTDTGAAPRPTPRKDGRRKRVTRGLLPLTGGGRLLRFPSRSRASPGQRPSPGEDQLYLAIGRVAANWSLLEVVSGLVLMGLVGSQDETLARAVVAGQRVENVWETIEALLVAYGDSVSEQLAEFRSWRRTANACRRRRNEAIHSAWSLTEASGKPAAWDLMSQRAKQGARADRFPGGVAELEDLARDVATLEARLTGIHERIFVAPGTRPTG